MKNVIKLFSIVAFVVIITLSMASCPTGAGGGGGVDTTNPGSAGKLTPNNSHFYIDNLTQMEGYITGVLIEPISCEIDGKITVYYDNSTTLPQTIGDYAVTFDVAASTYNWNAANGLDAGTFSIIPYEPYVPWTPTVSTSFPYTYTISSMSITYSYAFKSNGTYEHKLVTPVLTTSYTGTYTVSGTSVNLSNGEKCTIINSTTIRDPDGMLYRTW